MHQAALKTFLQQALLTKPRQPSHVYVKLAQPFVAESWHIRCLSITNSHPTFRNIKGQLCGWVESNSSDFAQTGLYELVTTVY